MRQIYFTSPSVTLNYNQSGGDVDEARIDYRYDRRGLLSENVR
jgi:hypothetical protein